MKRSAHLTPYPKRPPFFCNRVLRLLGKVLFAQEFGQTAALLMLQVVSTEDARRYRSPVTFWDPDLTRLVGAKTARQLEVARKKAVDAGWLSYVPGSRTKPGSYFVTIPEDFSDWDDFPTDEGGAVENHVAKNPDATPAAETPTDDALDAPRGDHAEFVQSSRGDGVEITQSSSGDRAEFALNSRGASYPVPVPVPIPVPIPVPEVAGAAATPRRKRAAPAVFVPPTVDEVRRYATERGAAGFDAEYFVSKNSSVGWVDNRGRKYRDWTAVVDTWLKVEQRAGPTLRPVGGSGRRDGFRGDFLKNFQGDGPAVPIATSAEVTG